MFILDLDMVRSIWDLPLAAMDAFRCHLLSETVTRLSFWLLNDG